MKTLATFGTFDLVHYGHSNFLKQCKKIADKVIVCLNTDEFIKEYKGSYPILNYEERKRTLLDLKYVDEVIPNRDGYDSKPTILSINPDILAIGSDWAIKDYYKQMNFTQSWLDEKDILLIYITYTSGVSTTEIKKRIKNL